MVRLVLVVEAVALMAAVSLTVVFADGARLSPGADGGTAVASRAIAYALCAVLSFYYHDFYDLRRMSTFKAFCRALPSALGLWLLLLVGGHTVSVLLGWIHPTDLSGALCLVVGTGVILPLRGACHAILKTPRFARRTLILGTGEFARKIAAEIRASPPLNDYWLGYVEDDDHRLQEPPTPMPQPIIGTLDNLAELIKRFEPAVIIVALVERRMRLPMMALFNARVGGTLIEDGGEFYERCTGKLAIEHVMPSSFLLSRDFVKPACLMLARRLLSCGVAVVGLVLTAPLMALIALAVKLDSKGSIFFVQERAGLHGKPFRLVKFRTMHPPLPSTPAAQRHWSSDLVRMTRVGKWLRRFYLDELPQLLNILIGHMDLVGPRPEMFANVEAMAEHIPYYALRTTVRPGLTGWAQIKQGYSVSLEEVTEKMRYDLYYIKHMSLWFDLRIIVDTVKNILLRRGT